ncbi:16S rRNA (cytosine(1407)-C(5))-methyltransferase RsmF [Candidatus Peregrinibacteria bacterium]|nr:16S rRNA (cytosine(1407)-C(5))-methyltransferase RsmF [Candidatus Peregrinibacteria bacterium]
MSQKKTLPKSFLEKMKDLIPKREFSDFENACLRPLRKSIRVNTLKISVPDFLKRAKKKNWTLECVPWCKEGFWIDRPEDEKKSVPLGKTGDHALGLFYIQEASSMLPPEALFSHTDNLQLTTDNFFVLDMAAAPGSKTTQISAKMGNRNLVIANEFSASRMKALFSNLERCGVQNSALLHYDGEKFGELLPERFDAILLDAPCTGEGTIRKDSDALKNWNERKIGIAKGVQKKLILSAFEALKVGGTLVYSTCTLNREENEGVCYFLKEKFPDAVEFISLQNLFPEAKKSITKEGFLRILPHIFDTEGFFVTKIRKIKSVGTTLVVARNKRAGARPAPTKIGNFPFHPISNKNFDLVQKYYSNNYEWKIPFEKSRLYERNREIWLFPSGIQNFIGKIRFDRIGIKMCEIHEKGIRLTHEMAMVFGAEFSGNVVELSAEEASEYYAGKNILVETRHCLVSTESSEILLRFDGFPLGLGKIQSGRIKNSLPRGVVREGIQF